MITKHKVESFIVVNESLTAVADGTRLYDFTTDNINVPVNNFAVFTPVANSGNPITVTAPTIATAPSIQLIKHRDTSGDRSPLEQDFVIEKSSILSTSCNVAVRGVTAAPGQNQMVLVGDVAANVTAVPVEDTVEYILNVSPHGWRTDLFHGKNTPLKQGRFTTIEYSTDALYTTDAQQRDHLLMNVADNFNSVSDGTVVALCIDSAGTAAGGPSDGVTTLTQVLALNAGDNIVIGFTDGGQPLRLTVDNNLIRSFADVIANTSLTGASQIVAHALPTATNLAVATRNVAGGRTAGTPDAQVDHLLMVSLKLRKAYYDEVSQEDERIEVGLDGGFGAGVANVEGSAAKPVIGSGEQLLQWYRDTKGYRNYPGGKPWQQNSVEYASGIQTGGLYDIYFIETCENRVASSGIPSQSPRTNVVAILNTNVLGFAGYTGAPNPMLAYFQTAINGWMNSTQFPHTNI